MLRSIFLILNAGLLFVISSTLSAEHPSDAEPVRLPLCIDRVCGFVDENGEVVLSGYTKVHPFADNGLALVHPERTGSPFIKMSYIDRDGNEVIKLPEKWYGHSFAESGLARISIPGEGEAFIDSVGELVSDLRFKRAENFGHGDLALVVSEELKFGFLGLDGELAVPMKFDNLSSFSSVGLAQAGTRSEDNEWRFGYINLEGEWAIPPKFRSAKKFGANGIAKVETLSRDEFYIRTDGSIVREIGFGNRGDRIEDTNFGIYPAEVSLQDRTLPGHKRSVFGYKNERGEWEIPAHFHSAFPFNDNGRAWVGQFGEGDKAPARFGIIDRKGNWILEPKFPVPCRFEKNGLAGYDLIERNSEGQLEKSRTGFVDQNGEIVTPPLFAGCGDAIDSKYLLVRFRQPNGEEGIGVIDNAGTMYGFTEDDIKDAQTPPQFRF